MAILGHNLILALTCVVIHLQNINCKPVKRSATDCYGTDCIIPQEQLDFHGNPRDTQLLENITASVTHAFPEIIELLNNIVYNHQNTTVLALTSIAQSLEDDKNLQTSQNLLIENGTDVMTRMVKSQQEMHERHSHQVQERLDRQYQLLANQQAMHERHNQWMQHQAGRQSRMLENVTTSLQQTLLPLLTQMLQIQQYSQPKYNCIRGLSSGQYMMSPKNAVLGSSFPIVCDMDTDGGGWTVFQRRLDGFVDFDRVWDDYQTGFGSLDGEFWLGLDKLYALTSHGQWELRVDLEDFDLNKSYATYDNFRVGDKSSFYRLDIGSYSGTAGDSMRILDLNGMAFTTKDQDHDQHSGNCAVFRRGAWWHNACSNANPNGLYLGQTGNSRTGLTWFRWRDNWQALKKSELKIRLIEG